MPYNLVDTVTGSVVGTYVKSSTAHKKKNAKDNAYGGYRFTVKRI